MDFIALTVVFLLVAICVGCAIVSYKVIKYRDAHFDEWTNHGHGAGHA